MEENLDKNSEVNKEIFDKTTKSNSEEIKEPKSEKATNTNDNNSISQNNSPQKVGIKNKIDTPIKTITKTKKELPV